MPISIILTIVALLLTGCQSAPPAPPLMSVEEAKKLTATFDDQSFAPPPRTIADITAILGQQKPDESYRAAVKARLDEPPPAGANTAKLVDFYARRSLFALQAGMGTQAVADARDSVRYARDSDAATLMWALSALRNSLQFVGEPDSDITREVYTLSFTLSPSNMWSMSPLIEFTRDAIRDGNVDAARRFVAESDQTITRMASNEPAPNAVRADNAETHVFYEAGIGQVTEAEKWARKAIDYARANALSGTNVQPESFSHPRFSRADWILGNLVNSLTRILINEGKLTEAEIAARDSLLYNLRRSGRTSPQTANSIRALAYVLVHQGRNDEAALLRNAEIATREALGIQTWDARNGLADVLAIEGLWPDAVRLYLDAQRDNPKGESQPHLSFPRVIAMYESSDAAGGLELAQKVAAQRVRTLGSANLDTALALGLVASGKSLNGMREEALTSFETTFPRLRSLASAEIASQIPLIQKQRAYVLEMYLWTLIGAGPGFKSQGAAEIAWAFEVADTARVASTDRAVSASVARARLVDRDLADLARREQDAQQQIAARQEILASALSRPVEEQNVAALTALRADIERLKQARAALTQGIEERFPDYANLVNPPPASVEQARTVLTNDEALVALYTGAKQGYVWALRKNGDVAFAVIPLRREQLADMVGQLRRALDPHAPSLGEIPPFDVALAHKVYTTLLQPVEAGWRGAKTLIVAPHGPLAQIPFSLLVTKQVPQPQDRATLFSGYRNVPFLARELAVTQVPSVAALIILRGVPSASATRRPFVGFGDPWFSAQEAAQARAEPVVETRGFHLRARPATETMASANLAMLPRLPDTAVEVREVAASLQANPDSDVFLGPAANEHQVRTMKLDDRRVVMFATHGLVPGDLDGLSQPALALSAPSVAGVDGDGLLTMDKILGLKLDADWVVLSACNSAAGAGAGAEAISGLGRAFFFAGARALLVTHWPVETTSARQLTTQTFKLQAADSKLTRAEALRTSMVNLIDSPGYVDPQTGKIVFSYAHPIFWAPFSVIGDGR